MPIRAIANAELLEIWEKGQNQLPAERALALILAADGECALQDAVRWSIGKRDTFLLTVREQMFGPRLEATVACPHCHDQVDLSFHAADIRVTDVRAQPALPMTLCLSGFELECRLPDTADLLAIGRVTDPAAALQLLLRRCVTGAAPEEFPPEVVEAIGDRMSEADPQARVTLALQCPQCAHPWIADFDILTFFWHELKAWSMRLLRDVHALASAYHWPQAEILALSHWRRQFYLQMVNG